MDLLASLPPGAPAATDVVSRKIIIDGKALSEAVPVAQVTINRTFNKITSARLVLLDGDAAEQDFSLSNENKFKPGSKIKIQLGYHGEVETVFEGIIVKHSIKIRQQGGSLLIIDAKDNAIKMTLGRKSRYFTNKTDKEAIEEIAEKFKPKVEDTVLKHKQLLQFECTDWDFIVTRAEANGMLVLCDDGRLVISTPTTDDTPKFDAEFGKNIIEFDAEMDARKQMKDVTAYAWDFTAQKLLSKKGKSDFSETGNCSSEELASVLDASVDISHAGYLTQEELQILSNAYDLRKKMSKAVGRVRIEGQAKIKPGHMISLSGFGDRFDGDVFVTGVLHQYEGYWQTDIQFGWKEDWFYKKPDVMDHAASGIMPGVNGLQIAVVQDINDKDAGQYRVKVHIPIVNKYNEGIWARVAMPDAGKNRGVYFRPQKGDEVILGFLNDDPTDPIILGCLHSKSEHPSPLSGVDLQSGIVTDKAKLVFDDKKKSIVLSLKDGTVEKSITINQQSGAIELKDEYKNVITMDQTGITIKAEKNVVINGANVLINT